MAGRPKLVSVNPAITCSLCKGYLINAMRLCRCMHAFCRSCIHRYLDTSSTCPTCQQRVFRSRMDVHMLPDHELQSIVYRVVPGLYEDEMRRRREYYENSDDRSDDHTEEKGFPERVILSDKDKVSVVLAYRDNEEYPKLYLELAAAMPVSVLLNFLRDKCKPLPTLVVHLILEQRGVGTKEAPDRLLLDPDFTIIDVCYIAKYNLQGPLKITFTFVQFDPESFKDKRLLESSAMSESSILRKSLNHRYRDEEVKGHTGVASQSVENVQYTKLKTDNTKSIVLSKNPAVESAVNSMKTYSRNAGSNGGNGNICQLTDGVAAGANASEGDSTEEEVDSWDSNVSTTIDSLTHSSQQHSSQQQQPPGSSSSYAGKPNKAAAATTTTIAAAATAATATNAGAVPSSGPSPASKSSKHSKSSAGASSVHGNNTSPLIVARPQSLRIDAMREKSDKPAGKQAISPVVQQSAPVGHHKRASQEKKSHHHHHHHHHKNHNASSTSTASASTVAGKPPTVLKIKLNTSPTTSETLTITSPPIRETRLKALEYPAVTSIKIKPIIAPPSPPSSSSSPSSSRETRAGSVESSGRKKRRSEDRDRTIKDKSPSEEEPAAPKKTKKAKTKKTTNQNTQAVINDTAYVSDQPKDLLSTSNFGWGDSSLWESQLRIPSPLTVPLTVSVARRRANQAKSQLPPSPLPPPTSSSFLEENFSLKKNKVVVKPAHNRIWRKRRHVSPPPVPVKLPPPDFEMSSTLSAVLEAVKNDKFCEVQRTLGLSPQRVASSPSSSPLRDCYFSKPAADHNDFPSRRQSETDHFLDSGVRPGSSSSGDINADVFRMEFPVAAINPPTTAVSPKLDRSQSYTSASPQSQVCQENLRRLSSSSSSASSSPSSASCAQVKFSIHNILSSDSSPPLNKLIQNNESKEVNIQETIEMFITNISTFFWALEASKGRVSARMSKTFLAKRAALEKILTLLRKLTIVVAPNQIERVLQLDSAIQKYFQTDLQRGPSSSDAHEQLRRPLESLRPDTLRTLEQNDVKVTPICPKNPSDDISTARFGGVTVDACMENGTDQSLSIVRLTPFPLLPVESTTPRCRGSARLDFREPEVEVIANLKSQLEVKAEAVPSETCEDSRIEDRPTTSDLNNGASKSENDTNRSDTPESLETPDQEQISDSQATVPEQDVVDICSSAIETFKDVKSVLDALLDSVERSLKVTFVYTKEDELTETIVEAGKVDVGVIQVEGALLVEGEPQSRVVGNDSRAQTADRDVPSDTNIRQMELDQNESDQIQVDQTGASSAEQQASQTELRREADELQVEPEHVPAESSIIFVEARLNASEVSAVADSEMHIEPTANQIDGSGALSDTIDYHEEPAQVPQESCELPNHLLENGVDDDFVQLDLTGAEFQQNEISTISKGETERTFAASTLEVAEIDLPVEDTEGPMDVTEDSVESMEESSQAIKSNIGTPGGVLVDHRVECTEVRIDSIKVNFNEAVDPHVNQSNSEVVQTESNPKNESKQQETDITSRQQVYDGIFGFNSCQSVVPYVPVKPNDSYRWASDVFRSKLGGSTILGLFPLRVPRISFVENEVSTCDPAPKTHKTGLELVPYVPRSENPIENLFRLTGLIPERVPIPSPVHDYIMKGDPTGIPNGGKQTKTHSLLDFLKLQQKSHVVQQNTSPNFGDIDMDVHRWEEVDELGGVAPPSGVANVPGSLNVH